MNAISSQQHTPLISIIIPIYNVEKYIERCARSLFEQTIEDKIEYIFVDDSTPDKSIDILKNILSDYPNRIPQTKILHHSKNKGLPQARETGVKEAQGEYILHVDSDDWVEPNICSLLIKHALETKSDFIIFDFYKSDEIADEVFLQIISPNSILSDMLSYRMPCCVWNKMVRKRLYKDVEFAKYNMGEDLFLTFQLAEKAKTITYLPEALYHYFYQPTSISRDLSLDKRLSQFYGLKKNTDRLLEIIGNHTICCLKKEIETYKFYVKNILIPVLGNKGIFKLWRDAYRNININVIFNNNICIKHRIRHVLIYVGIYQLIKFVRHKYKNNR